MVMVMVMKGLYDEELKAISIKKLQLVTMQMEDFKLCTYHKASYLVVETLDMYPAGTQFKL